MYLGTRNVALIAGSTIALAVGAALIVFTDGIPVFVGTALVILSVILFLPFMNDFLDREDEAERTQVKKDEAERER